MFQEFSEYDTVLAIRQNSEIYHKGFLLGTFQNRSVFGTIFLQTVYMLKSGERDLKKFYGKKHKIRLYSTRIVLTEKYKFYIVEKNPLLIL